VVPYGEDAYYRARPLLAVAPPNAGNPAAAVALNSFFGLHPGLAPLVPIYQAGHLAVLPAVHYTNATRSHFDGQAFLESGTTTRQPDGWLNRHLTTRPVSAELRAVSFGNTLAHALRGAEVVSAFQDLEAFSFGLDRAEDEALWQRLDQVYSQSPDLLRAYREDMHDFGQRMLHDLGLVKELNPQQYQPANGAVYPETSFGQQLQQTAQLIKAGVGLEVAALNITGWDTHRNQGGGSVDSTHFQRLRDFASGLAAFYTDLDSLMTKVVVLTMTEFGRTVAENASGGTDHGHASTGFAMGHTVHGGIHGTWPGLLPEQLYLGRYLKHTIDFRNVFGEVIQRHLGNTSLPIILPGHTYQPIGFLQT
jgi:uncharacterized protein (DUF1501 family)